MPCKVGITTDPEKMKSHWESQVDGFSHWSILGSYDDKRDAQAHVERHTVRFGCHRNTEVHDTRGKWYVYKFQFTGDKVILS